MEDFKHKRHNFIYLLKDKFIFHVGNPLMKLREEEKTKNTLETMQKFRQMVASGDTGKNEE